MPVFTAAVMMSHLCAASRGVQRVQSLASGENLSKHFESLKQPLHIHSMGAFTALTSPV